MTITANGDGGLDGICNNHPIYGIVVLVPFRSRTERDRVDVEIENEEQDESEFKIKNNILMF